MSRAFSPEDLQAQVPRLRRYARALAGSREAADDLTQDTLERAWAKRALWQQGTSLRAWLFTIMHNVFINSVRGRREELAVDPLLPVPDPEGPDSAETAARLAELRRALLQLPDEQREVVLLVGLEQFSYAETATVLGIPAGTVMSRLSRGRERLRQILDGAGAAQRLRRVK
jgi:RNA polymerase sigma-70 factor (ECF subfamily)